MVGVAVQAGCSATQLSDMSPPLDAMYRSRGVLTFWTRQSDLCIGHRVCSQANTWSVVASATQPDCTLTNTIKYTFL